MQGLSTIKAVYKGLLQIWSKDRLAAKKVTFSEVCVSCAGLQAAP